MKAILVGLAALCVTLAGCNQQSEADKRIEAAKLELEAEKLRAANNTHDDKLLAKRTADKQAAFLVTSNACYKFKLVCDQAATIKGEAGQTKWIVDNLRYVDFSKCPAKVQETWNTFAFELSQWQKDKRNAGGKLLLDVGIAAYSGGAGLLKGAEDLRDMPTEEKYQRAFKEFINALIEVAR